MMFASAGVASMFGQHLAQQLEYMGDPNMFPPGSVERYTSFRVQPMAAAACVCLCPVWLRCASQKHVCLRQRCCFDAVLGVAQAPTTAPTAVLR